MVRACYVKDYTSATSPRSVELVGLNEVKPIPRFRCKVFQILRRVPLAHCSPCALGGGLGVFGTEPSEDAEPQPTNARESSDNVPHEIQRGLPCQSKFRAVNARER